MITARSLSKSFGRKPVLRDLSFCARAGEITLLIGPNGAGKTTTMRLLTGLAQPDGGTAAIAGRDIVRERIAAQQLLSYLPQNPSFHPRFTC
ncbi:MAG: ATP-binding cassette domain-containing protein, partial [Terrimicrobiaceae bacterium]